MKHRLIKRLSVLTVCFFIGLISSAEPIAVTTDNKAADLNYTKVRQTSFVALKTRAEKINLHWKDNTGKAYQYFANLNAQKPFKALINAGIYSSDNTPAGLYIENFNVKKRLNNRQGKGNFHLQPNGVFFIDKNNQASILSTADFLKKYGDLALGENTLIRLATQSGPMLLIDGKINPILKANSETRYARTGVCLNQQQEVILFATDDGVLPANSNLYDFAQAAKQFGCIDALYLDGKISKLYVRDVHFLFHFRHFVGILSVTD